MKHGLFKKYFLGAVLIITVSFGVMALFLFITYNNYLSREKSNELKNVCNSVTDAITDFDGGDGSGSEIFLFANSEISYVRYIIDCDIVVTDENGAIVVCCCNEWYESDTCGHIGTVIDVGELKLILSGKENFGTASFYAEPRYLAATPLNYNGKNLGYVLASADSSSVKGLINNSLKIYLLAALAPLIIMFAAFYIMAYRINRPLKLMSEAAKAMAKGDFSRRIPVTGDDEIGELAASFNAMTNSLSRLEETRKSFIANVSHEMRTPMTTISGFIDGIIDGTIEPDRQSYYLGIVSSEIKRLSRMVQSMLSIARLESSEFTLKKDNFDLREQVLNIVIGQERRIDEKQINIEGLDVMPSVTVNADKDLIYQVVYNLVDNAIKFVDVGGRISFALGTDEVGVKFTITNTGKGIPRGDLPFIFDRYYKLDKSRSDNKNSMGLGLYIVKTIIKNHGGTISVSSKENEFTSFQFVLPFGK